MTTSLRLAAALTHQLGGVVLTVRPPSGRAVHVARAALPCPDLTACEFRAVVLAAHHGDRLPPGLSWLLGPVELSVGGPGARHVGDGVVALDAVDGGDRPATWSWSTLLPGDTLPAVLGDASIDLFDDGPGTSVPPAVAAGLVEHSEIRATIDVELGVTVVTLARAPSSPGTPQAPGSRHVDEFARMLGRACVVAELISDEVHTP